MSVSLNSSTSSSLDDTFRLHRESLGSRTKNNRMPPSKNNPRFPPHAVILIANSDPIYPERTLVPPTDGQSILIGRATASDRPKNSDSAQPGPDNAKFICPVMSKAHAQLSWKNNQPVLQDTKSTHGTWYRKLQKVFYSDQKGQTSTRHVPRPSWESIPSSLPLQDGMSIRFGRAITNPCTGSRFTPLEVTVRIPKSTGIPQSGTYGLIDPYLTFSDDSEEEEDSSIPFVKPTKIQSKKGSSESDFAIRGLNDRSEVTDTQPNNFSLGVEPIDSTFKLRDSQGGSAADTTKDQTLGSGINESQASAYAPFGLLAKRRTAHANVTEHPFRQQPVGSKTSSQCAPSTHKNMADSLPLKNCPPRGSQNRDSSPSNPVRPSNRFTSDILSPSKLVSKKGSSNSTHSANRGQNASARLGETQVRSDDQEELNRHAERKCVDDQKVDGNAGELPDDGDEEHSEIGEVSDDYDEQTNHIRKYNRTQREDHHAEEKRNGIEENDSKIEGNEHDSEENDDDSDEEHSEAQENDSDIEGYEKDAESDNSDIEEKLDDEVEVFDVDDEPSSPEGATNALETINKGHANCAVSDVERNDGSKVRKTREDEKFGHSDAQHDDGANSSSDEQAHNSSHSSWPHKAATVNPTQNTVTSKTSRNFKDVSVVTTITSKTHFTESLNRLPENCVQVSFKLEPLNPSPLAETLTEDHVSSRMPLDANITHKSPKMKSLPKPGIACSLEENLISDGIQKIIPITKEAPKVNHLKRKRPAESDQEEADENMVEPKPNATKHSIGGVAFCAHCSSEIHKPKKQKLSTHVLSAARSLFIFALGGAATVAGILAFENIIE